MKMPYEVPQLQLLAAYPNDGTLIIGASGQDTSAQGQVETQDASNFDLNSAAF